MSYDPREPVFPTSRDFRRHPEWAVPIALLLWWVLPGLAIAAAAVWTYRAGLASPAPLALALAASIAWAIHARD